MDAESVVDVRQMPLDGADRQVEASCDLVVAATLRDEGYLPLWQPWLGHGEPAIENPFSFTLNPISSAPKNAVGT